MKLPDKIKFIISVLNELYPEPEIPLKHENNFTFLIAVMLSAQSTDKKVNQITPRLFEKANTPEKMDKMDEKEIRKLIREIGLAPTKAKNIKATCKQLLEKHNGVIPANFEDLENLAGVGHKTASVIMAQAFKTPAFPVDTHIHRIAFRWGLSNGKNVQTTETDLKSKFEKKDWSKLHLQMIFYGREHCKAKKKVCECRICEGIRN